MRTTAALFALALAVACGGDKADDSSLTTSPTGTATGTASGTGTGSTTSTVEDCTNGADDDGDGLLDCEDDDCATDPACGETNCTDGLDDDGDGRIDCTDEDCWGNGCAVTVATMGGFDNVLTEAVWTHAQTYGDPACAGYTSSFQGIVRLANPHGTVRTMPASTASWTTCSWSASSSYITVNSTYAMVQPNPVSRTGFTIDAGCPIQDSGFLPAYWAMDPYSAPAAFHTRPTGTGPMWWTLDLYGGYNQNTWSTSTTIPGSPCVTVQSTYGTSSTWYGGAVGSDYTLANP